MTEGTYRAPTYGNWRRPTSAGVFGLGAIGTGVLLAGGIATVLTMRLAGLLAALIPVALLGVVLLLLLRKDLRYGRTGLQRLAVRAGSWGAQATGANLYRSGLLGFIPHGRHQLPGLAAGSELTEHRDTWDEPFALIAYPSTGDYVVALVTEPDGAALVDPQQVDLWVAKWGAYLAMCGGESGLVGVQVVIETAPDSGTRLRGEVEGNVDADAPAVAQAILREVVDTYPQGAATVKAWVVLTFSAWLRGGGKRRTTEQVARDLAIRLPGLRQGLAETGAGAAYPATARDLCEELLVAFDPAAAHRVDSARASGVDLGLSWDQVGPVAAQATWEDYRHDSGLSVSWEMSEAPRGEVFSSVLAHLVDAHPDVARKRVALLYRPHDSAAAATTVERDKKAAETRVREAGKRATDRDLANRDSARQAAREEAKGAGLTTLGMVVTATVTDPDRLPDAVAAVDNLSATARVGLRRVYGSQDSAFAFALPLGLVPSRHLAVPSEIRDNL